MKRLIAAGLVTLPMLVGVAAHAASRHPNLQAAHTLVLQAIDRIDEAKKANDRGDLGGHANKAKDLLKQAEQELYFAAMADNKGGKDDKNSPPPK